MQAFANGSAAQAVLSRGSYGDYFSVNWGFAVAVMMGVYVSAGVSGGHINPAVTTALAVAGKVQWKRVPAYFMGQYLGAFCGAAAVFGVYYGNK